MKSSNDQSPLQVEEGNRLIAEFMGGQWSTDRNWYYFPLPLNQSFGISKLKYHSSWDWQIPAWSKVSHETQRLASDSEDNAKFHLNQCDKYEAAVFQNDPLKGFSVILKSIEFIKTQTHE